jgi:hypothetical protein
MAFSGILVAAGTSTTNPDPNTLGTPNPYPTPYVNVRTVSAAWAAQTITNSGALFPVGALNGQGQVPIPLMFVPSAVGATYTVTLKKYGKLAATWVQPKDYASFNMTGSDFTEIVDPGENPWFIQLSNISSGTVAIYFDNGLARAQ